MSSKEAFRPKSWQVLRFEVFKRDNFRCVYCGATPDKKELHCDHVTPRCEGGKDEMRNLVTACKDCNEGKWGRVLSKVAPTFGAIFSAVQRKKRAMRRLLAAIESEEMECLRMEKEIAKTLSWLRHENAESRRTGVIVRKERPKRARSK